MIQAIAGIALQVGSQVLQAKMQEKQQKKAAGAQGAGGAQEGGKQKKVKKEKTEKTDKEKNAGAQAQASATAPAQAIERLRQMPPEQRSRYEAGVVAELQRRNAAPQQIEAVQQLFASV